MHLDLVVKLVLKGERKEKYLEFATILCLLGSLHLHNENSFIYNNLYTSDKDKKLFMKSYEHLNSIAELILIMYLDQQTHSFISDRLPISI